MVGVREIQLTEFHIIRLNKPTIRLGYFREQIGIVNSLQLETPVAERCYRQYSRNYGIYIQDIVTDNIDIIGTYKTNDIIKKRNSYIKIKYLRINQNNIYLVGEDLSSGLERRFPIILRAMKTYIISKRIQTKLDKEKATFLEHKKSFNADIAEMIKSRSARQPAVSTISPFGKYKAVRNK